MYGSEIKKYKKYSLVFVVFSLVLSVLYCFWGEKSFSSNIIYIVLIEIIAQVSYFISAHRGDVYIKNNYKELYNMYHLNCLTTPDNIMLQMLLKINFRRNNLNKEAIKEKDEFCKDTNYGAVRSDACIATTYSLFAIIFGFIYLILLLYMLKKI